MVKAKRKTKEPKPREWSVQVLGGWDQHGFEISVVRSRRMHERQKLYGWFDDNKLSVASATVYDAKVKRFVWDYLVASAGMIANGLNDGVYK